MFCLSTAYWGVSVPNIIVKVQTSLASGETTAAAPWMITFQLFNALILINVCDDSCRAEFGHRANVLYFTKYVLADGVVVWRAWVLCHETSGRLLLIPFISLLITFGRREDFTLDQVGWINVIFR